MTTKKRFQSGHEIFKEFIPDYDKSAERMPEKEHRSPADDASDLAAILLREFDSHLKSKV